MTRSGRSLRSAAYPSPSTAGTHALLMAPTPMALTSLSRPSFTSRNRPSSIVARFGSSFGAGSSIATRSSSSSSPKPFRTGCPRNSCASTRCTACGTQKRCESASPNAPATTGVRIARSPRRSSRGERWKCAMRSASTTCSGVQTSRIRKAPGLTRRHACDTPSTTSRKRRRDAFSARTPSTSTASTERCSRALPGA